MNIYFEFINQLINEGWFLCVNLKRKEGIVLEIFDKISK